MDLLESEPHTMSQLFHRKVEKLRCVGLRVNDPLNLVSPNHPDLESHRDQAAFHGGGRWWKLILIHPPQTLQVVVSCLVLSWDLHPLTLNAAKYKPEPWG